MQKAGSQLPRSQEVQLVPDIYMEQTQKTWLVIHVLVEVGWKGLCACGNRYTSKTEVTTERLLTVSWEA